MKEGVKGHSLAMERNKSRGVLTLALFLALLEQGGAESERDFKMCGTWSHGKSGNLWFDLSRGCETIAIAANQSTLSIQGRIMGTCENSTTIPLPHISNKGESPFCVFWDPLLDLVQVEIGNRNHTLCRTVGLQESCCTFLSPESNEPAPGKYGIMNGSTKGDVITKNLQRMYSFFGENENCKQDFCEEAIESNGADLIEHLALRSGIMGEVDLPCAEVSTRELKQGFQGLDIIFSGPQSKPLKNAPLVSLPSSLMPPGKRNVKMVMSYYKQNILFQKRGDGDGGGEVRILNEVVGISVENEVIANLPDPVKIIFRHGPMAKNESTKCVFWDTREDPAEVTWRREGCDTIRRTGETECRFYHLTYFAVLVELRPGSMVDHLEALTYISGVCCAISFCSCVGLIFLLTKALRRKPQDRPSSIPIHRNLAIALLLLCLLFMSTGVLANVGTETLCRVVGAALHYSLLCSFTWMAIEVFSAFMLVYRVMDRFQNHRLLSLVGFGLPAVLVIVLVSIKDIYGTLEVVPSYDINNPYKMCWIKLGDRGVLVHYVTNVSFPVGVVLAGVVMLFLVLRQVQTRREWKQNRATFLSIWGLSCLFGCTWGLAFLNYGALSEAILFLFCVVNSLQGFFLMLRFSLLEWMKRQGSVMETSTGSTRQQMLQEPEKC
ncbi:hypothetical protein AAFF_G00226830 [Aldrovandia affinis]|uniref:Uncharacterized protein n=1 Tax=Aldrovandia affinis TaxID=143900 RepID=A0AAD7X2F9_9TELE|nr:hypothetical protein AAFF_G00226830 [Aldrovandia affinis]